MSFNKVISEILRGQWFMNIHSLDSYLPIIDAVMSGKVAFPEAKKEAIISYRDINNLQIVANSPLSQSQKATKTAVISMVGPVLKYGDMCSYGAEDIAEMLHQANNDESVKAIVMYIDGPGGSTSAIAPFIEFAAQKKKPVVVLADSAYSLHYWTAAVVADHIMADNNVSSGFGSIGVYVSFLDVKGAYEQKGYKIHEVYSDLSGNKNEVFRLALEGKYEKIKEESLNPLAKKFQEAVRASRPNLKEEAGVLTGKTFYAEEALSLGMIDSIGNMSKAVLLANALADLDNY